MVQPFLSHLRVLDFSWAAAGPYATELLGFMGAEILKVESARRLDLARRGFYQQAEPNTSTDFNDLNLNKRSLCINLSTQVPVRADIPDLFNMWALRGHPNLHSPRVCLSRTQGLKRPFSIYDLPAKHREIRRQRPDVLLRYGEVVITQHN